MITPAVHEVVRVEHEHMRLAREDVAYHEQETRRSAASPREQRKARLRAFAARRRLVRALARKLLAPGPERDDFLDRLEGFLAEAKLDTRTLDVLVRHLSPDEGGT